MARVATVSHGLTRQHLCMRRLPSQWSNAAINSLLDLVDCRKDQRDPLAMKQAITELQPELGGLKLK